MKKKLTIVGIITTLSLFIVTVFSNESVVSADKETSDDTLKGLYEKYDYILHIDDGFMITDLFRNFLWGVIKLLSMFNNFIEGAVYKILNMNDFYSSPAVSSVMDVAKPLVFGLFVIAILVLGFQFMMNKIEKREEIFLNILMAVTIIMIIPILMTEMHKVVGFGVGYMQQSQPTLAGTVVQSNIADLEYYMDKRFVSDESKSNKYFGNSSTPPLPQNKDEAGVGTTDFTNANRLDKYKPNLKITETIDVVSDESWIPLRTKDWVKDLEENNRIAYDFMKHKSMPTGVSTGLGIVELNKNEIPGTNIGREAYYRWHVNWGTIIITLLVTSFALIITIVKIGRIIFDLAFHQLFGMFIAVTDLTGGQRTKKVLAEIANSFGVLFIMVFILQLFILYSNWINTLKADIGFIPVLLLLVAGAWALIDAPNIVERMMGIDAGLRSGYGALMGAYAGAKLAGGGANIAKNVAGGAVRKSAGAVSFGAGTIKGMAGKGQTKIANIPDNKGGDGGFPNGRNLNGGNPSDNDNGGGIPSENNQFALQSDHKENMSNREKVDNQQTAKHEKMAEQDKNIRSSGGEQINNSIPSQADAGGITYKSDSLREGFSVGKQDPIPTQQNVGARQINKGINNDIPNKQNPNADMSKHNQRGLANSQKQMPSKGSISDISGYSQTDSGFFVPRSVAESMSSIGGVSQSIMPQSPINSPTSNLGSSSVNVPSNGSAPESKQPVMPQNSVGRAGGGWITGSQSFGRLKDEVQRAGNSGYAVGAGIRKTGQVVSKGAINSVRAVVHPKEAVKHTGAIVRSVTSNVGGKMQSIKEGSMKNTGNVIKKIKTPIGQERPISKK